MAIQLLPILGAALRGAGSSAGSMLRAGAGRAAAGVGQAAAGASSAAGAALQAGQALTSQVTAGVSAAMGSARGAALSLLPQPPQPRQRQRYDEAKLKQRLGVANLSQQQIDDEKQRIDEANKAADRQRRMQFALSLAQSGAAAAGFTASVALATAGATKLGEALNDTATNQLRIFNAAIAALGAKKEAFQVGHMVRRGQLVQGTTVKLGETMMDLKRANEPYAALGENVVNVILDSFAGLALILHEAADSIGITSVVRWVNSWLGDPPSTGRGGVDFLEWAAKGGLTLNTDADNQRPDETPGARPGPGFP